MGVDQTYIYNKFGLKGIVNLIFLGDVSVNGVGKLGISVNEKARKFADEKIKWLVVESG